jgi:acyl-CoA dehydrogenase
MEVELKDVRVPAANLLLGEGRGFEIAQGRLGPGRIHHCMRSIGAAERALELMCQRLNHRVAFGRRIAEQGVTRAHRRVALPDRPGAPAHAQGRLHDGHRGQQGGAGRDRHDQGRRPQHGLRVIDWAIQAHGGAGISDDFPLASMYAHQRTLRFADGPDEVHRNAIAKLELAKHMPGARPVDMPITRGS